MYRFRLAPADKAALEQMSKVYGAANPSAFIREMVSVMCSNDMGRVHAFLGRLTEKITGQLTLGLQQEMAAQIAAAKGPPVVQAGRKALKRAKGRKRQ